MMELIMWLFELDKSTHLHRFSKNITRHSREGGNP